ncbi:MAG: hypothetical protein ACRC8A_08385 [Microcoleaceae cyanobacterium]
MKPLEISTAYSIQPEDTLSNLAQKSFGDEQKWQQIRRPDGTHFKTIHDPEFTVEPMVYCAIKVGKRSRPGYGTGDDFNSEAIQGKQLTSFERQIYEFLVKTEGLNPLVNRQIVHPLFEHFFQGKGGTYQQGSNTELAQVVTKSKPFKLMFSALELQFYRQLQAQVTVNSLQLDQLNLTIPQVTFKPLDSMTLFAALGGIQGADLLLKSFSLNESGVYSAHLWLVLYDDFGLGRNDRYTPGLTAAWNLQHRGTAKPFIHEVMIALEICGHLSLSSE